MSIAAKTTANRVERSPGERVKLLRYCLARLRAWEMEYRLYSSRSATIVPAEVERVPTVNPIAHETIDQPTKQESNMVRHVPQSSPAIDTPSTWESFGGSIDTHSISSGGLPYGVEAHRPAPAKQSRLEHYSLQHEETASPAPKSGMTMEPMSSPLPAMSRSFRPLPQMSVPAPPVLEKPMVEKLRIPKVVAQILGDVPDHWKQLAQGIESRVKEAGLQTLLVTAALRGEGATTVATAVSVALATHTPLKVVLVDCDLGHPAISEQLKLNTRVGIEHHLLENVSLSEAIITFQKPSLAVLPAMEPVDMTAMPSVTMKLREVIERLEATYDLVVIDIGSLFAGRRPVQLPTGIDATLIVRDPTKSSPELLDQLDSYLARQGISSLGVIENGVDT